MNFKKNKDVKRSSYYVWFLGAKESKGLRGDEYVTPVLSYLIDNECEFEPSKVTLQVSNKGLKIIQILTVPRKSSKLSADQQTQLFANSRRSIAEPPSSSVLKTEQVKHHIPHNSITWIYQEDDVICAILLLYNPITRCPVHVHAYRCDSIETADNLRQQLQTLVDKPENQKKFREIESRLAAKGLLLPPHSYNYLEDEMAPTNRQSYPTRQSNAHPFNSPTNSKTLNSDGRSTRTEGSDENSEESNSSDLGYGIRSIKNNNHDPRNEFKRIPAPPPMHSLNDMKKSFAINDPSPLDLFTPNNKSSNKSKPKKVPPEEAEIPVGVTAALYDSLAAELRAKLGNPKMGPILLPPRDYESTAGRLASAKSNDKKNSNAKDKSCVLTRSESSGKSSSGIGSDEALSTENKKSSSQYYRRFESDRHQPQSFIDIDQHKRTNRFLYPHHDDEKEKKLYSLQVYSSDEDNFGSADALDTEDIEENVIFSTSAASKSKSTFDLPSYQPPHQSSHRSSSNQPLPGQKYRRHHQPAPTDTSYVDRKVKDSQMSKLYASHPNLVRAPPAHQIPDSKENNSNNHKSSFVIGRREQRSMQQINQHNNSNGGNHKMDRLHTASSKEMPLSSMSSHNVNKASHKSNGKPITSGSSQPSSKPIQKFYFADAEFCDPRKSSPLRSSQPKISHNLQSSNYRSNGNLHNLDYGSNGPTSLNYHHVNRRESQPPPPQQRSISPYFYSHQDNFDIKPKSSPSKQYSPSHQTPKQHKNQSVNHKKSSASSAINARTSYDDRVYGESHHPMPAMRSKFKDQPYSRYSYIDVDHHSNETRMGFFKR